MEDSSVGPAIIPQSVNYHFTRQCNYQCGFCFHTAKTSFVLPIDEAKRGLQMLKDAGLLPHNYAKCNNISDLDHTVKCIHVARL